jgi:hypothetical protein
MRSNNNNKLKAFVRCDGSGRIIPGSLNVQSIKPKVGNWRQINSKECCLNNECIPPIYACGEECPQGNWIINDVISGPITTNIVIVTAPWISIEFQLIDCDTNLPVASIICPKNDETNLYVPTSVWENTCNIRVRGICGPDFSSDWVYLGF